MRKTKINIAILAKAPVAGLAKTRLIPTIGAHAAAVLQERLTERTVVTALEAGVGPVTLWCAPEMSHASFRELAARFPITLKPQAGGDLGARMLVAMTANAGPTLVIGTDCPAFTADHLRCAAAALNDGAEVVLIPAEDGGYVLVGAPTPQPQLFSGINWGTATVMPETRARIAALGLTAVEFDSLWDVDTEADLARCERLFPELAL
jgi:rSAM/selenodomain-associated transferase 1